MTVRLDDARLARLVEVGTAAGLDRVGACPARPWTATRSRIEAQRAAGRNGSMAFTYRNPARSTDPTRILRNASTLVVATQQQVHDGFLVSVGSSKFILPLDAVVEVIESHPTHAPADAAGRHVVELRGQVLPVVSLRALYALDSAPPERSSVVVLQSGERRYGVMVDGLLGQHQTVIKPLGQMFRCLRGMAGSSILGNGEVALIFDVASLCQLAEQVPAGPRPASQITPTQPSTPQIATQG